MAHMSIPCHEGPPATAGHLCSEPAVAGGGRYYCNSNLFGIKAAFYEIRYVSYDEITSQRQHKLLCASVVTRINTTQ